MKYLKSLFLTIGAGLLISLHPLKSSAQQEQATKVSQSIEVLDAFKKMKDEIPHQLFEQSQGIIIIPKMINAGFVIGGKRGRGVAMVRLANGKWSDPSFVTLTGGSFGFQIGVQSVDLILFFTHSSTLRKMNKGSFTLGGDASATAGPVGRSLSASTDYKMEAEIYSYSRSRGAFAGVTINGADLSVDQKANDKFYDTGINNDEILKRSDSASPEVAELKSGLNKM